MYLNRSSFSDTPNCGTRYNTEGRFWVAKRVVCLYLNWAAAVSSMKMIIDAQALAEHIEAIHTSLPRRPIAFRAIIQLGSRMSTLQPGSSAYKAIVQLGVL
jgi:hypothetical protein